MTMLEIAPSMDRELDRLEAVKDFGRRQDLKGKEECLESLLGQRGTALKSWNMGVPGLLWKLLSEAYPACAEYMAL